MGEAKQIIVRPVKATEANALVRRIHYSGAVAQNSQLHLGVFLHGALEGVMQFGPSIDKRRMAGLVEGTNMGQFMELNRMAFSAALPRNSESRALSVAFRMLRKVAPQIKWIVSFADATQCGDGAIYRAAGFDLVGVKRNRSLRKLENGVVVSDKSLNHAMVDGRRGASVIKGESLEGFQIKYVYFLEPEWRSRLTVPILGYDEIAKRGARMYRGKRLDHAAEV